LQLYWKRVRKKELSRTKFHGFQAKWDSYGHNHNIVCSNEPILCICVHLGMKNNVDLGSFNFRCTKKSFFIFLMQKMFFLWSVYQKYIAKIEQPNFKWYKNSPLPRRIAAPPPDTVHYAILRYVPILLKRVIRSLSP
jgi:hypothetical protein